MSLITGPSGIGEYSEGTEGYRMPDSVAKGVCEVANGQDGKETPKTDKERLVELEQKMKELYTQVASLTATVNNHDVRINYLEL